VQAVDCAETFGIIHTVAAAGEDSQNDYYGQGDWGARHEADKRQRTDEGEADKRYKRAFFGASEMAREKLDEVSSQLKGKDDGDAFGKRQGELTAQLGQNGGDHWEERVGEELPRHKGGDLEPLNCSDFFIQASVSEKSSLVQAL